MNRKEKAVDTLCQSALNVFPITVIFLFYNFFVLFLFNHYWDTCNSAMWWQSVSVISASIKETKINRSMFSLSAIPTNHNTFCETRCSWMHHNREEIDWEYKASEALTDTRSRCFIEVSLDFCMTSELEIWVELLFQGSFVITCKSQSVFWLSHWRKNKWWQRNACHL